MGFWSINISKDVFHELYARALPENTVGSGRGRRLKPLYWRNVSISRVVLSHGSDAQASGGASTSRRLADGVVLVCRGDCTFPHPDWTLTIVSDKHLEITRCSFSTRLIFSCITSKLGTALWYSTHRCDSSLNKLLRMFLCCFKSSMSLVSAMRLSITFARLCHLELAICIYIFSLLVWCSVSLSVSLAPGSFKEPMFHEDQCSELAELQLVLNLRRIRQSE